MSKSFFKEAKKAIVNFIWCDKKPKISYCTLVQPISKGGLGLADLECQDKVIKESIVKRLCFSEKGIQKSWYHVANELISGSLEELFRANMSTKDVKKMWSAK